MFGFRYPAVILFAGTVIGTLLGREIDFGLPVIVVVFIAAACFLIYGFLRLSPAYYVFPLVMLVMTAAILNANRTYRSFPADDIGRLVSNEERLHFFGKIVKWPVLKRHQTILACRIDSIATGQMIESASGTVLLDINRETTHFALGDQISFSGHLRKPFSGGYPGQFDYARYLHDRGIRGLITVSDPAYVMVLSSQRNLFGKSVKSIRRWITACFQKNLGELPAALASGFLIGETRDIPDEVYRAFRRTGTMHLLAVSGSNVALVLAVIVFLLRYLPLRRTFKICFLLVVIVVFSHLSYNQPSVVRASIMAALIILARASYRRTDMHNVIAAAAVILIFYDPGNLYDIGFQLSFAVTWGLILFLPHINRLIADRKMSKSIRYFLLILFSSLIATIISAPITIYYFGEVSLVTAVSNLLVVPLVSLAVIGIAILLLTNLILPAAAILPGMFLNRLLELILGLVTWFDKWKFAAVGTNIISGEYVLIFLVGITLIIPAISYRFMRKVLAAYIAGAAGFLLTGIIFASPPPLTDIEVHNHGATQTIIINRGEGIVIFYQNGYSRHDSFGDDLIPYLTRRNGPFPRYFVFMEPRYRTERRLDLMADKGLTPILRPCYISDNIEKNAIPFVWVASDHELSSIPDTCAAFTMAPGIVVIDLADSGRVLFAVLSDGINALKISELRKFDYRFLSVWNDADLARIADLRGGENIVILLQRPADEYPTIYEGSDSWAATAEILGVGREAVYMELPRPDPKKSY